MSRGNTAEQQSCSPHHAGQSGLSVYNTEHDIDVNLQIAGFAAVFALFLACGLAFNALTASPAALQGFQAMYYISSFFAQFVNATTFLLVGSPGHSL